MSSDDRLPRVLMAIDLDPSQKFGTLEEQVLTLARAFRDRDSRFLPLYRRPLDREGAERYDFEGLRAEALDLRRLTPGRLARLLGLIRAEAIDVVHWNFHVPLTNPYLWALSALAPRVRHVYTDHISRPAGTSPRAGLPARPGLKPRLKRALAARYDSVVCVSDFVRDCLKSDGWGRLWAIPHFVNTERFAPDLNVRCRVRAGLRETARFVALVVSYLIPEKGVDVALRAFSRLPNSAVLWVIGDGPESLNLQLLAGELGVDDRVRWLGLRRNVEPYMQAADCLVCPSLWAEAAGLVNIEALATGLPVVASAVGGIPEIVRDGVTGYLVPPGDPGRLADRLLDLLTDPTGLREMACAARAEALGRFAADAILPEHLDFYRALIDPAFIPARPIPARAVPAAE